MSHRQADLIRDVLQEAEERHRRNRLPRIDCSRLWDAVGAAVILAILDNMTDFVVDTLGGPFHE